MWPMILLRILLLLSIGVGLYQVLLYLAGRRERMRLKIRKKPRLALPKQWQEKCRTIYFVILTLVILLCFICIKTKIRGALW